MAIDRLRLYLAVKVALAWHRVNDRGQQLEIAGAHGQGLAVFDDDLLPDGDFERCEALVWAELREAFEGCDHPRPIDMVLYCPRCHLQHIDAPEMNPPSQTSFEALTWKWDNPPHRSHLCHACGFIWRPADVPTNGVQAIKTRGRNDS